MAWRTTQEEVRTIIETDSDLNIAPFLDAANALVDYIVTQDSAGILSAKLKEQIEKWLAAHFYAIRDLQYKEKKTGDASAIFQGRTGMGFDASLWGQQAKALDITGTLQRLDTKPRPKASLTWVGKPVSEQTDYVDRD